LETSYHVRDLPPGLYQIYPDTPDLAERIYQTIRQEGLDCLVFPFYVADYLVAGTVHRETAFDLENQGLTGAELTERVDQIISESPFRDRALQTPTTLSGGEQQLLAITVALQQPQRFFLGQYCLDFLSYRNLEIVQHHLAAHGKSMLEITYGSSDTDYGKARWQLIGNELIPLFDGNRQPAVSGMQAMAVPWQLNVEGMEKRFENSTFVLGIPHMSIDEVRCLGIHGENGSGKTTLADCITGITPHDGKIEVGIPGVKEPRLGYLIQHMGSHTHGLPVAEILQKFSSRGRLSAFQGHHLESLLNSAHPYQVLTEQDARLGFRLVVLAALLAGDYDFVVLDEPTYGLPTEAVADFLAWALDQIAAKPLAIISHDNNFLTLFCDKIIHLENGVVHEAHI
jgi:energy-coupling factor transporter ATP-binding protein EcfA2